KRVPLNQNECTANFRIGVPFEQNLQIIQKILLFFQRKIKILRSPGAHKNIHEQIKLRFAHG
ncbi:hypothetical protein, partial [Mediterraneibacter gnavus]|uniref:hypothetical protein n=1 Tax=Mediterraneibacter gnavus TaxID=33038 RepID=UPI0035693684